MIECSGCVDAKKAFLFINRVGIRHVSTKCDICDTIWSINDNNKRSI